MIYCPTCGHQTSASAKFCTRCGAPLTQSLTEAPTQRLTEEERPTAALPERPTGPTYAPPPYGSIAPMSGALETGRVDVADWLAKGWQIYRSDAGTFSLSALVLLLLSLLSLGLLAGPLTAGFYRMVFKKLRGEQPQVGDLFKGMDRFWPTVFAWVIHFIISATIGGPSFAVDSPLTGILSILLTPLVWSVFMFVYPLILEQQQDTAQALEMAGRLVFSHRAVSFWVAGLILWLVFIAGFFLCGIGGLVTAPLVLCAMAVAYCQFFGLPPGQPTEPFWSPPPPPSSWMGR